MSKPESGFIRNSHTASVGMTVAFYCFGFSTVVVLFSIVPITLALVLGVDGTDKPLTIALGFWSLAVLSVGWYAFGSSAFSHWRASSRHANSITGRVSLYEKPIDEYEGVQHCIRIEELEFDVRESVYRKLREGNSLTVRFHQVVNRMGSDQKFIVAIDRHVRGEPTLEQVRDSESIEPISTRTKLGGFFGRDPGLILFFSFIVVMTILAAIFGWESFSD